MGKGRKIVKMTKGIYSLQGMSLRYDGKKEPSNGAIAL
jgi:hypothetical protein